MKKAQKSISALLAVCVLTLSSCFHIIEEVTFRDSGKGSYSMMFDMSDFKNIIAMLQNMAPADSSGGQTAQMPVMQGNPIGKEQGGMAVLLKDMKGISNILEVTDSTNLKFGFTFDFEDVTSLNKALKTFQTGQTSDGQEDTFKFDGQSFERRGANDFVEAMKKNMSENKSEGNQDSPKGMDMAMFKMFFGNMSFKQIYHFPDREINERDNSSGNVSEDKHTLNIVIKIFDEEPQKKKGNSITTVNLK